MFDNFVGEKNTKTRWTTLAAFGIQSVILGAMLLIPLIWYEAMPLYQTTWITAPAPPAPPPPPAARPHIRSKPTSIRSIEQPREIPKIIDRTPDLPKIPDAPSAPGEPGGIPGGVPGGTPGGISGGVSGGTGTIPVPKPLDPPMRIVVGGDVVAARLKKKVSPQYPPAALKTGIQGTVILHAIISKAGRIQELGVLSGPALLQQAALEAVKQWEYDPTLLNGHPVEVETTILVVFRIS